MTIAKGEKCFYESKTNCDGGYVNCDVCGPESFSINLGNMKITLDSLPIIVGAALLGPLDGFLIGFFGSFFKSAFDIWFNTNYNYMGASSGHTRIIDRSVCKTLSF